MIFQENIDI